MSGEDRPQPRFEEQSALRELEDLQRAIEESRGRRKRANEAFDTFLRSFSAGPPAPPAAPVAAPVTAAPAPAVPPPAVAPPSALPPFALPQPGSEQAMPGLTATQPPAAGAALAHPAPSLRPAPLPAGFDQAGSQPPPDPDVARQANPLPAPPLPAPAHWLDPQPAIAYPIAPQPVAVLVELPFVAPAVVLPTAPPLDPPRAVPAALTASLPRHKSRAPAAIAVAILIGAAMVGSRWMGSGKAPVVIAPGPAAPAESRAPVTAAPAQSPVIPAAELSTTRRVWVRVTVDGVRTIERELPADARVPLAATSRIVVRTGDAGAVRLAIGGKDQGPLGGAGEVATRTFALK